MKYKESTSLWFRPADCFLVAIWLLSVLPGRLTWVGSLEAWVCLSMTWVTDTCHATCPDGWEGLGIQSPLADPITSDAEQRGVVWGRGEGSQLGGNLFCARGLGSLWLLLWVPGSLSSTLKEAMGSKKESRADPHRASVLRF